MHGRRTGLWLALPVVALVVGGGVSRVAAQSSGTTPVGSQPTSESSSPAVSTPAGGSTAASDALTVTLVADLADMALSDAVVVGNDVLTFAAGDTSSVVKLNPASGMITGFFGFDDGDFAREFLQVGSDLFIPIDTAVGGCDLAKVDPIAMALTSRTQLSASTSCRSVVADDTKPGVVWGLLDDFNAKTLGVGTVNLAGGAPTAVDITAQIPADYSQQGLELAGGFGFIWAVPGYDDAGEPKKGPDGKPLPSKLVKIDGATVTAIDLPGESFVLFRDGKIWVDASDGASLVDPVTLKLTPTTERMPPPLYGVLVDGPFAYDFYKTMGGQGDAVIGKFELSTTKQLAETKLDTGFPADTFIDSSLFKVGSDRFLLVSINTYNPDTQASTRQTKLFKIVG